MTLTIDHRRGQDEDRAYKCSGVIEIALLNNMPDGAIKSTEHQFARLLSEACDGFDVCLSLYEMPALPRSERARAELMGGYRPIHELLTGQVDGLIVTGCEPKEATLTSEPYWETLAQVIDWADDHVISSIWSCLAAHAAILRMDGIERRPFETKLSGLFQCRKMVEHPLVQDLPMEWMAPHSRQYGIDRESLLFSGYTPLTVSTMAGVDIFIKRIRGLYVLFQGHLEYESDSLLKEYLRDINRYLNREREIYPQIPHGLFGDAVASRFKAIETMAMANRSPDLLAAAPVREAQAELMNAWRNHAVNVYRRWLLWIAEARSAAAGTLAASRGSMAAA